MPYQVNKVADGDNVIGHWRSEHVNLIPALSDYPPGGYLLQGIGGFPLTPGNVGIDKIFWVIPIGGQSGYSPVWNPVTSKLQILQPSNAYAPQAEIPANTNLNAFTFMLLVVGI